MELNGVCEFVWFSYDVLIELWVSFGFLWGSLFGFLFLKCNLIHNKNLHTCRKLYHRWKWDNNVFHTSVVMFHDTTNTSEWDHIIVELKVDLLGRELDHANQIIDI